MIISVPLGNEPVVNQDRTMSDNFRTAMVNISNIPILIGTGSPEGVVTAVQTRLYMDDSGGAGSVLYIKRDKSVGGDVSKGWILI